LYDKPEAAEYMRQARTRFENLGLIVLGKGFDFKLSDWMR
jgi:hypothetical protein